ARAWGGRAALPLRDGWAEDGDRALSGLTDRVPVLEMVGISKRFDATQALGDVSLTLYPGEVHALVGENGAGKSTLIKIMTGIHPADEGTILVSGEQVTLRSSADAQRHGIAAIYQEQTIYPDLNVAANICMGHRDRGVVVRWGRMYREAETILARLDVHLDVRTLASGLSVAAQQAVEIAKAMSWTSACSSWTSPPRPSRPTR